MCGEFYLNQQKSFVCVYVWKRGLHLRKRMHQLTVLPRQEKLKKQRKSESPE